MDEKEEMDEMLDSILDPSLWNSDSTHCEVKFAMADIALFLREVWLSSLSITELYRDDEFSQSLRIEGKSTSSGPITVEGA